MKKRVVALGMAAIMAMSLVGCGSKGDSGSDNNQSANIPTLDSIETDDKGYAEAYKDVKATIKVLTNRTDIVDTVYKGYADQFHKLYPNITVEYEGITDYESTLDLRLTSGDWGDVCFIPTSLNKDELSSYFIPLGDYDTLNEIYNFCVEKSYDGKVYGLANGGTAGGVVYNKKVWKEAGIEQTPKTPDEFLEDLKIIKEKTKAIPLYTNFAATWPMGAWDAYIGIAATGNADFMNNDIVHTKNPFSKRSDMTGPYAVYYTLYEAVARKLIEDDPASTDWESSKGMINKGEIATMVLGSWAVQQCKDAGDNPKDVGYMPFPITVNGKQYAGAGGNYAFGINKDASEDNQIASMLYVKWLTGYSSIYEDEGSIPALKSGSLPAALSDFNGVELLSDNPAKEGEETLFNEVNSEGEVGINNDDKPDCDILEAALYGEKTLDQVMDEWNARWTAGQESVGVEVNE